MMGALTERHRVPYSNQLAKTCIDFDILSIQRVYLLTQALSQSYIIRIIAVICNFMIILAKLFWKASRLCFQSALMGSKCSLCTMYRFRHPVLTCRDRDGEGCSISTWMLLLLQLFMDTFWACLLPSLHAKCVFINDLMWSVIWCS